MSYNEENYNSNNNSDNNDLEWEEWDGNIPFWHHCLSGCVAGVAEHVLVFPLDTVCTHIQVCSGCPNNSSSSMGSGASFASKQLWNSTTTTRTNTTSNHKFRNLPQNAKPSLSSGGMWQTIRYLVNEPPASSSRTPPSSSSNSFTVNVGKNGAEIASTVGNRNSTLQLIKGVTNLFRGIQTVFIGCIPAHGLYFSTYEIMKTKFTTTEMSSTLLDSNTNTTIQHHLPWYGSMIAGGMAALSHDCIMVPSDTIKQRLQLGHYNGSATIALRTMIQNEGAISLYRSFPITLLTNVPYGMIMVFTNEYVKEFLLENEKPSLSTTLLASSVAGFLASACTTPLDRLKTTLQTQQLKPACLPTTTTAEEISMIQTKLLAGARHTKDCPLQKIKATKESTIIIRNWYEAFQKIIVEEGTAGLFRGMVPRILSHTPAAAISWTTYETMKQILASSSSSNQ